jgi:hypothetical protein
MASGSRATSNIDGYGRFVVSGSGDVPVKPRLESASFTDEDIAIWKRAESRFGWWQAAKLRKETIYGQSDRRDASAMLTMVELHASRVVQVPTGDWCYFGHSSEVVFQDATLQ